MSRLLRSAAAGLLTVLLCLGTSTGPVLADDRNPADPTATVAPVPTETAPTETTPTETESTRPEPIETRPTQPTEIGTTSTSAPATTAPTTTGSSSSAAPIAPAAELADLQLRVWFDKPFYQRADEITVHASVTNAGTATANQVIVNSTGNLTRDVWDPFWPDGVTVAPGQTVDGTLAGFISNDEDAVRLVVTVSQRSGEPDANPDDNTSSASVPVVLRYGSYRGTVFGDRDGDRVMDPGEGLADIPLLIEGGNPYTGRTEITDANGAFAFRELPPGSYQTSIRNDEWYLTPPPVDVDGVDDPDVLIRGVPRLNGRMAASVAFTQPSYQEGDLARAVLTLHNTSAVVLTGLGAECSVPLEPFGSIDADVGELAPNGPGVVLPAGATREFAVTVPVTAESAAVGHARLSCAIGAPLFGNTFGAQIAALTHVAGGIAPKVTGKLLEEKFRRKGQPFGDPLPGIKLYLRDHVDGKIVTRDVTGSDGTFTFHDVPAGLYHFGLVGPWQITYGMEIIIRAGENGYHTYAVFVRPGPYQPDPDPAPPAGGEPVPVPPPVTGQPPLAVTGAGVTRLALSGLLTLLLGAGLVLLARQGPNGPGSRRT